MPSGSRIVLRIADPADVPTPDTGQIAFFADSTNSDMPSFKDDVGTVHSLQGADAALTYTNHGNTGASEDIDAGTNVHRIVLNNATVTLTTSNWPASGTPGIVRLIVVQDGTGGRLISWPGAVTWGAFGAPTLQTGASAIDVIDLQSYDGGTTILGSYEVGSAVATAHIADTTDAHDASAISADTTGYGNSSASEVQTVLDDFDAAITAAGGGGGLTHTTEGTTSAGGSWETVRGLYVKKITLASAGQIAGIWAHIKGDGTNAASVTVNIYSDSAGSPINLMHGTPSHTAVPGRLFTLTMNTTARWYSFGVGTWWGAGDYWIGIHMNAAADSQIQLAYAASGSDKTVPTSSINQPVDSSIQAFSSTTRDYSIYADIIR